MHTSDVTTMNPMDTSTVEGGDGFKCLPNECIDHIFSNLKPWGEGRLVSKLFRRSINRQIKKISLDAFTKGLTAAKASEVLPCVETVSMAVSRSLGTALRWLENIGLLRRIRRLSVDVDTAGWANSVAQMIESSSDAHQVNLILSELVDTGSLEFLERLDSQSHYHPIDLSEWENLVGLGIKMREDVVFCNTFQGYSLKLPSSLLYLRADGGIRVDLRNTTSLVDLKFVGIEFRDEFPDAADIAGLTALTRLKLDAYQDGMQDWNAYKLLGLPHSLLYLQVGGDIEVDLRNTTSLVDLRIVGNEFPDAADIAGLTALTRLELEHEGMQDWNAYKLLGLPHSLLYLRVGGDIEVDLRNTTSLVDLRIDGEFPDAADIAGLTALTSLELTSLSHENEKYFQVYDMSPLTKLCSFTVDVGGITFGRIHLPMSLQKLVVRSTTRQAFSEISNLEQLPTLTSESFVSIRS
jgi:hypothetical protein